MSKMKDRPQLYDDKIKDCKAKCECGHVVIMPITQDKMLCIYCGRMIRNNSKAYFMHKLKETMNK